MKKALLQPRLGDSDFSDEASPNRKARVVVKERKVKEKKPDIKRKESFMSIQHVKKTSGARDKKNKRSPKPNSRIQSHSNSPLGKPNATQ